MSLHQYLRIYYTKTMRFFWQILLVCFFSFLLGCEKDERAFIVSVDGRELTKADLDSRVSFMVDLRLKCVPNISAAELQRFRSQLVRSCPILFEREALLASYAEREGIVVSSERLDRFKARAVRNMRIPKVQIRNWSGLVKALGDQLAAGVEARVRAEALEDEVKSRLVAANPTNLPPDFAEKTLQRIRAFNRDMDATNVLIRARASAAWEELKAGADFGDVAAKYSEIPEERKDRGEWANLDWKQVDEEKELSKWARQLNVGEFSPPIEADNGLMIARVDRKDERDCVLSRIYFCLPMFCAEPKPEEIVSEARRQHADNMLKAKLAELRARAKIVRGNQGISKETKEKKNK